MKALRISTLLAGIVAATLGANNGDPDDVNYLRGEYAIFQSLPAARRQQLQELDQSFHALDKEQQDRLLNVMEKYNWWLTQLPEPDRRRVVDAATSYERLKTVQELKDREWVETLPKVYRDKYARATKEGDRLRMLELWREEEHERREEWRFVRRNWDELKDDKFAPILQSKEFHQLLEAYVLNLDTQLSAADRERLKRAREMKTEERAWYRYLVTVVDLADHYVLLPGAHDGARTFDALPKIDREALEKGEKFKKKNLPKEMQTASGRWPDFAIATTEYALRHNIVLPKALGPSDKTVMPAEIKAFIVEKLEPTLEKALKDDKTGQAKRDLARLNEAAWKWPDYPRTVMELARQYRLFMAGWMLPGDPKMWDRFRVKQHKK